MSDLAGKAALITGTSGIGRAIAIQFAEAGAQVFALGIDGAFNKDLAAAADARNLALSVQICDVADPIAVTRAVAEAVHTMGGVDLLVNAAAIHPFGTVLETDFDVWNRCMAVNVGGMFLTARAVIPEMRKRNGGSIVNLASVQGYACQVGVAAYATSKGAVQSFTRALALDHAADRIRVNSISPGSIATPMLAASGRHFLPGLDSKDAFTKFGAGHPLGRVGTPEEVAALAVFLCSDQASFCTGSDFLIDGGLLAQVGV